MREAKPGLRCAGDTRGARNTNDAYRTTYPDGPAVDPLTAAANRAAVMGLTGLRPVDPRGPAAVRALAEQERAAAQFRRQFGARQPAPRPNNPRPFDLHGGGSRAVRVAGGRRRRARGPACATGSQPRAVPDPQHAAWRATTSPWSTAGTAGLAHHQAHRADHPDGVTGGAIRAAGRAPRCHTLKVPRVETVGTHPPPR